MVSEEPETMYEERQQYNHKWLWIIYLVLGFPLLAIVLYSSYSQLYRAKPFVDVPEIEMAFFMINGGILLTLLLIPLFINALVLKVSVYPDRLKIKLGPWLRCTVNLEDLEGVKVVNINPREQLAEYGLRKPGRKLKSHYTYHISGTQAVELRLSNGTQLFVGSQQPAELQRVLNENRATVSST